MTSNLQHIGQLTPAQRDWMHQLVGDWQIIADVSFADLLLIVRVNDELMIAIRHCRPATAGTMYPEDVVGDCLDPRLLPTCEACLSDGGVRTVSFEKGNQHTFYPVTCAGTIIALLDVVEPRGGLYAGGESLKYPSLGANEYVEVSSALLHMVTTGEFPLEGMATGYRHGTPRLTDGFVHLDAAGAVIYASPNAISNFHRLGLTGQLSGEPLAEMVTNVLEKPTGSDTGAPILGVDHAPWLTEIEAKSVILALRAVPLRDRGKRLGTLVLCRDVTEIRRREQELVTKDATIREINHRVKNNLQTVSALLRMQARRAGHEDTRAALNEAQRRVATIALVHQVLSQSINERASFDDVIDPLLNMASDIAATGIEVQLEVTGEFGEIGAAQTTALAVVLNELVSNAVEHGFAQTQGGTIEVHGERNGSLLTIDVLDDGCGVGPDGPGHGLGTSIMQTLVGGELGGTITWTEREGGGTRVHLEITVEDTADR